MITLFTASPGGGKTASVVDILSKLPKIGEAGYRPIYSDGLNGLSVPHEVIDASFWHTSLPDGAILVVDEVQRVWRPRPAGSKVPDAVSALETHRHRGIDVYLTTQAPSLLDTNVRALVGRHVHIRDTGIMGRWWYEWPETNVSMQWKSCVNKRRFKLPKSAFELYKSASLHTKPVRGIPSALIWGLAALVLLSVLAFYVYTSISTKISPVVPPAVTQPITGASTVSINQNSERRLIDDRVDFIPRVSNKPESAPAYDHLRVIVAMPVVVGGWCQGTTCRCITQQGTNSGLSDRECQRWLLDPPFDNYRPTPRFNEGGGAPSVDSRPPANPPAPQATSTGIPALSPAGLSVGAFVGGTGG